MKELSNVLTAVFTGVSAVATVFATWIALRLYRKGLREESPAFEVFMRFKSEQGHRSGKSVVRFGLSIVNIGKVPFHVVEWLPLDPADKLDVSPSVCHQNLDPRAGVEGEATLTTAQNPDPIKVLLVLGDCRPREVVVVDRSYYRSAEEARQHVPVSTPIVR